MKRIIRHTFIMFLAAFCLFSGSKGIGEAYPSHYLLTGEIDTPVALCIQAPEYTQLAQFGRERLDSLNRLLRHISIDVSMKEDDSETVISIDQEPVIIFTDYKNIQIEKKNQTQKEAEESNKEKDEFSSFLEEQYFRMNQMMDDLYPVFCKAADSFPEMSGKTAAVLNFSGFGKSTSRMTIQFPSEYVNEHFPDVLESLCESQSASDFLKGIVFHGSQKIVLMFDQNDKLLRINYDGTVGTSEEELRRISLVWKCLRTPDHIKDSLVIKTPAVKGYNRDNISYDRNLDLSDPGDMKLKWDYQLDQKKEKVKTKIRYTGDLSSADTSISGKILYHIKGDNHPENSISISAGLDKEKEREYTGTLEITNKTGKIVTSSVSFGLSIGQSLQDDLIKKETTATQTDLTNVMVAEYGDISEEAVRVLIRRIMALPEEDTEFLRKDIPDDLWEMLTNH